MDSNWVLILLVGVAIISYYVGSSKCDSTRVVYKWLPRNLDEETDQNANKVLKEMIAQDVVELAQ